MHKVWIADDDQAIRLVLEESLKNAGFEAKLFSNHHLSYMLSNCASLVFNKAFIAEI